MNIRAIIPATNFSASAVKEKSEEERRKDQQRNKDGKKKFVPAKTQPEEIAAENQPDKEVAQSKVMPKSEVVIELLSHPRQRVASPLGSQAFTKAAKIKKTPSEIDSKLNKKY